jgi:AcrR family transcriptional regulator
MLCFMASPRFMASPPAVSPARTATTRRPRAATPEKRRKLLDATELIMLRDGYAAVTSRRLEAESGLKVHYHFGSIDDLFIAVVRRRGEANLALMVDALASPEPLRAWWRLASDRRGSRLLVEITAAANHRPAIQDEVAAFARETRRSQLAALGQLLDEYGIDRDVYPPSLVAPTVQGLAFAMAYDQAAGFDTAQAEASAAMERLLDLLEARRASRLADREDTREPE